ncbi:amino acid adenylation domain-containing protein [Bradyrhizobium japonicum]
MRSQTSPLRIEPCGEVQLYPLSFQQERVLYLNKLSSDGPLWNRISCKRLVGRLDIAALKRAIDALVERHAVLRTRIALIAGTPFQSKHDTPDGTFELVEMPAQAGEDEARALLNREYQTPFTLEGGWLFKVVLVRRTEAETWLILKLHHIISDATTLRILWGDLKVAYNAALASAALPGKPAIGYFDYAKWQRSRFGEESTRVQEAYWLNQFAGQLPELDLPIDDHAGAVVSFHGALARHRLSRELTKRIQKFSLQMRVIPFSTMLSACYLLLHHYCRQDDIVVGSVFSGRHYTPQLKALAGFFSNTVALRARLDPTQTVEQFVKATHASVIHAYEMQDYPFERLVDKLAPDRGRKQNPLFRALFNMISVPDETQAFSGVETEEWREPDITVTQVDLFFDVHMGAHDCELRIEYNANLFAQATVLRMLRHYATLLDAITRAPDARAGALSMLDDDERRLVLSFAQGEAAPPPPAPTVVDLLEERAARAPGEPAIVSAAGVLTCEQVNRRVNQLAATLVASGVDHGATVAVLLERSPEMVIALLAILKAGAAYLPLDPQFPLQRILYILQSSGARTLLLRGAAVSAAAGDSALPPLTRICVDEESAYSDDEQNLGRAVDPAGPAYVIYTSGSTGRPKGVIVEHRALMNTLAFLEARYALSDKTILLKTNYTFDVAAAELFGWLFAQGRLAVLDADGEKDPAKLLAAIASYDVTHINFVPSMLDAFLSAVRDQDAPTLERLHYVFAAGEPLKPELVDRFHARVRGVRLENLYGPTEAAIYASRHALPRADRTLVVPIGRPFPNTRAYILDAQLNSVAVGLTGELCLSGAGLARGYLNDPALTDDKFRPNPHWPGERLYRTGDLAKWSEDGLIQCLGRSDGQVKIRGFRIEIGEVERKLRTCTGVADVAIKVRTDGSGQKELVAYLVMQSGSFAAQPIRDELAAWLPAYMIPAHLIAIERLPRLASGKINMQALPEPWPGESAVAPALGAATELEQTIIDIAERLLNARGLNPSSSFFQLGGNSLLTLRFIAAVDAALGTRLSVIDFLELPTIREMAALVESSRARAESRAPDAGPPCDPGSSAAPRIRTWEGAP